jgi:hypothetical protein
MQIGFKEFRNEETCKENKVKYLPENKYPKISLNSSLNRFSDMLLNPDHTNFSLNLNL